MYVRKTCWGYLLHVEKNRMERPSCTTQEKIRAVCLGAVEEILLAGWNEGKVCKEVVL